MPLPSRSASLLAEMARSYGAADQIEDPMALDVLVFRSFQIEIVYRPGRDVFSFAGKIGAGSPALQRPARIASTGSKLARLRKLRLFRPNGEVEALAGEVGVADLTFAEFAGALDDFLDAVELARAGETIPEESFAPPDLPADELIWIKT